MATLPLMGLRELAVIIIFTILATLVVVGRFWARWARKTKIAANDYLVLAALVFTWGVTVDAIVGCFKAGTGKHVEDVTKDELLVTAKLFVAFPTLWGPAVSLMKLAVLSLYLTIFRSNRTFEVAVYMLMAITICYGFSVCVTGLAICHPVSENTNPEPTGACANKLMYYFIIAIINIVLDWTIFLLPVPMLWSLQMKTDRKMGLSFLFGLGLLVCIISVFKTMSTKHLDRKNIAYTSALDWIWSVLEADFGIICACLPVMQPVWSTLKDYFSSLTSTKGATSQRSLRTVSRKLPDERKAKRPVEDKLYPLSNLEGTRSDTRSLPSGSDSVLEKGEFGESVTRFNT